MTLTKNFIKKSSNTNQTDEAYSVFRNKQNDDNWKFSLNSLIINEIQEDLIGTLLEKYI